MPEYMPQVHRVVKYSPHSKSEVVRGLSEPCGSVKVFDSTLRELVADMFKTMYAANGIGLAANQIGIKARVAVVDISFGQDTAQKIVLVNPVVLDAVGKQVGREGCLSLPGLWDRVERAAYCTVDAQDEYGQWREIRGEGLLARALQHEVGHLNGQLFIDCISKVRRGLIVGRINKLKKKGVW